ncbi:MAG: excisionase family DNA-binding protein [Candidatus Peribacteria bacterium]|jgi:excisionase family DNA binding protein|nr:excisionase family DNA-binding protein [Candidatus Peribacteria bacterium]
MAHYSLTRDRASVLLGVSTRTIDRYIKSGKLSYKKVANKVLLSRDELDALSSEFSALRQEVSTELVSQNADHTIPAVRQATDFSALEDKIDKFALIFNEKDKMLEEKNKVIFLLQQRIGELENKIQNMIALPDYTKEKQEAIQEKQRLEAKLQQLTSKLKEQEMKTFIVIGFAIILIAVASFLYVKMNG